MNNIEETLKNFDQIIGTNKYTNIQKSKFPLILKIFNILRDDITITSDEYNNLNKCRMSILKNLENTFTDEQKVLFEKYWEFENKMRSMSEENIFLFGYLIKDELNIEV